MANILNHLFTINTLTNIIDIVFVWFLIYKLLMMIRGTKAIQLIKGSLIIIVIKLVSWFFNLRTLAYLTDQIFNWSVIVIIIIFAPEIRRGLEKLGRMPIFFPVRNEQKDIADNLIAALDKAIQYMSKRRIGALITLQMDTGLEEYIETGIPMDANITGELLINIFIPNTPLHDGAVIINDNKIATAAAYLPLSESNAIPKKLGTRHRAAVGISEVTDALTIVVSEETGEIMITHNNHMMLDLSQEDYLNYLRAQLEPKNTKTNSFLSSLLPHRKKGER
ncbi:diadenylate cyclase CdaA [Bombilactobacillus thymidiniphilus]|uniref:Diadenylate cyclase n=1 Tax=Bombilactobacillus thymidiniphilus TaxID=2923363 RepID=A0ABY4PE52_9LACO|nr:diadenylate cyclase CdaA [Bombilactobacillus thymidiniphilus]UQS83812.1 diadenylate cyclase CdaA [Bombilactobacillus thymidiniphilus]